VAEGKNENKVKQESETSEKVSEHNIDMINMRPGKNNEQSLIHQLFLNIHNLF